MTDTRTPKLSWSRLALLVAALAWCLTAWAAVAYGLAVYFDDKGVQHDD